jgi:enediyne biosynthesis protein E4
MRLVAITAVAVLGCSSSRTTWFAEVRDHGAALAHYADPDAEVAGLGAGIAAADVDGDGLPELAVAGALGGFRLYQNLGGLQFRDATVARGIDPEIEAQGVAFADLDNDGDQDLVIAAFDQTYVYENRGGTFVAHPSLSYVGETRGIHIFDFDNDGLLDVLLLSAPNPSGAYAARSADTLYRNTGALGFADVTAAAGIMQNGVSLAAASVDYDLDGVRDLYIAKDAFSANFGGGRIVAQVTLPLDALLANDWPSVPALRDRATSAGIAYPRSSMGIIVADFDGNGLPDFYISDYGKNSLFINQGSGQFAEQADDYGLDATTETDCTAPSEKPGPDDCLLVHWGSAALDADNDGWDDVVVINGSTFHFAQEASQFRGGPDGFAPVDAGLPKMDGRTLVAVDLDRDGDLDLVVGIVDGTPRIFENLATRSHWLEVQLVGTRSNRDGVGAVVTARFHGVERRRYVGAGGVIGGYTNTGAHFGLGAAGAADLEIHWPDGATQIVAGVTADQAVMIQEPAN